MAMVLIVDDSAVDRRLAAGLLKKAGDFVVSFANHGREALDQLQQAVPDIVLTDIQMPEMDGFQLVTTLKRDYPLVPVILMTAAGSEEMAVKALREGAASYVPKRRLSADLVETVRRLIVAASEDHHQVKMMHRMTRNVCSFSVENDITLIAALSRYLRQAARTIGLCDEREQLRIGVAVEEALLNAYYHGNLEVSSKLREENNRAFYDLARERACQMPYCNRQVHVEMRFTHDEAVFVIRDEGPGFDAARLPDPTDPSNLERPCGRGVMLMRTFMDEILYNEIGNQVTLVKRRTPATFEQITGGV